MGTPPWPEGFPCHSFTDDQGGASHIMPASTLFTKVSESPSHVLRASRDQSSLLMLSWSRQHPWTDLRTEDAVSAKKYEINEDGSITFAEGEVDEKTREKAYAEAREKATEVVDDVEIRETAEGKTEREKAE